MYIVPNFFLLLSRSQATHFALAFEVPGWNNEKEAIIATVLQVPNSNTLLDLSHAKI